MERIKIKKGLKKKESKVVKIIKRIFKKKLEILRHNKV